MFQQTSQCGSIHFTIEYDFQGQTLIVQIIEAKDLVAKDWTLVQISPLAGAKKGTAEKN